MTLYLVGLGIYGETGISRDIVDILRKFDRLYLDIYTSPVKRNLNKIREAFREKGIEILERKDMEDESSRLLKEAEYMDIAILVPGDPFIATTHVSLILEAKKLGIEFKVIHASSALCTAIGESGLHTYKFGPSSTIMRKEKASSERAYNILIDNMNRGLHTLFFLEYDYETDYAMSPYEAVKIILSYDDNRVIKKEQIVIVLCGLGSENEIKKAYTVEEILYKRVAFGDSPCILIFPGELHFTEREYINLILR